MNKIKTIFKYPILLLFAGFIYFFSIADVVTPDRLFSSSENRNLAQMPKLTWNELINGDFTSDFETYVNDQFFIRDTWIDIKAKSETALGKIENNDIIYGYEGYSFIKRSVNNDKQTASNMAAVKKLLAERENAVLALIPSAASILTDYLPAGSPVADETAIENEYCTDLGRQYISLFEVLQDFSDEYIYYRTDHHWTTLGAYYAYDEICEQLELQAPELEDLPSFTVEDFFGSHYRKTKRPDTLADTITLYDMPITDIEIVGKEVSGLYNMEQLQKDDKYAAILHDNNGLTVINSEKAEGKKDSLLILKDSYGNSIAPFFTANYESVSLIDLRYFNTSLAQWLDENEYDDILVLYNFDSIQDEKALYRLGR